MTAISPNASFWDRIAPRYAQKPVSNPDAYEETLARTRVHLRAADRAYEVGCGTGSTALRLAEDVASYTAADVSEGMISIARDKAWDSPVRGLQFEVADHTAIARADVILAFNLLHLVPDPNATIRSIYDTLPSGGRFISKTPCLARMWYLRPVIGAMRLVGKAPPVVFLSDDGLQNAIRDVGFDIVESDVLPVPSRFVVAVKP